MFKRLVGVVISSKRSELIARAKSGDPISVGLVVLYFLYRFSKRRSSGRTYVTKLLPGQTISISNIPRIPKKG
ncbi:MAG: hypothetical protein M0Z39_04735 [Actinomycetota bacterium]|jgi:hypothetical protein|nr:hypothetical protein [Actinomycetota bacterium]